MSQRGCVVGLAYRACERKTSVGMGGYCIRHKERAVEKEV